MNPFTHPTRMYDVMDLPMKVHAAATDISDDALWKGAFSIGMSKATQANILLTAFITQIRLLMRNNDDERMDFFVKIESDRIRATEKGVFSTNARRYGDIIGEAVSLISCVDEVDVPPDVIRTVTSSGANEYVLRWHRGTKRSSRKAAHNLVQDLPERFPYLFLWGLEMVPEAMRELRASVDMGE